VGWRCVVGGAVIAGGLAGGEALGASESAHNLPPKVPEWMKTPGDPMGSQLYGTLRRSRRVLSRISQRICRNIYPRPDGRRWQDLDGIITPNGLFYERHHAGVPTIDPAQHRLMLHGLVDKSLIFTMDDIRRFPSESRIHFLECSGNPGYKKPYGKDGFRSCRPPEVALNGPGQPETRRLREAGLQHGEMGHCRGRDAAR